MKKLILATVVALSFVITGCDKEVSTQSQVVESKVNLKTAKIKVGKMTCQGCANGIKKKVSKLVGVDSIDVSYATSMAIVSYDPMKIETKSFSDLINNSGYETLWFE
ncbi:MAG: heavy-metal-associated domain-containing protein [Candidatus Cloacimonetes bacterium]|nr:heavy-metal-associated domain-containing protein [Candidatus Cloacimonadota bacterium]